MRKVICIVVLAGLLAACAQATVTRVGTAVPDATTAPSGSDQAAVVFEQSGGIDGSQLKWTILNDGTIMRQDAPDAQAQTAGNLTLQQVTDLVTGLDTLGFF